MTFCIVQRDLDRHLAELSRLEQQDEERDEIRHQVNILVEAFNFSDQQMFLDVVSAAARTILDEAGRLG